MRSLSWSKFLFVAAVVLLVNALLPNLLFRNTPLRVWKQILAVILFIALLMDYRYVTASFENRSFRTIKRLILLAIIIMMFQSIFTFTKGFSLIRILFAEYMYLGGIPFLILPLIFIYQGKTQQFFTFISILGIVLGVGLTLDHFYGIFEMFSFGEATYLWASKRGESAIARASFLFESPTAISYFNNFCLICLLYKIFTKAGQKKTKLIYITGMLILLIGTTLTASRQVIVTALFIVTMGCLVGVVSQKDAVSGLLAFCLLLFFIPLAGGMIYKITTQSIQFYDILRRIGDIGGSLGERGQLWKEGLALFGFDNMARWMIGQGIGDAMGSHVAPTETVHHHYESALFMTFHEGGWPLLFVVYWPTIATAFILLKQPKSYLKILLLLYLPCVWGLSVIAPGILHPTAQMCIYFTLGMAVVLPHITESEQPMLLMEYYDEMAYENWPETEELPPVYQEYL